ncbi:hypothetical protein Cgig2_005626 [Carnegiea gigantea]|uniref:Uncharacterized protein n=1 Tax=Carnegiea gigantea TaxID=171969 RepID=A0A9Q1KVE2_9CARY|nr:hypothetical protein Cgig2_005626 [Carnegiea gigantea]
MAPAVPIVYSGQKESKGCSQKNSGKMSGKSRKFPMGNPGGLMADYRHAVEITAESEGFGSSGRVDTEMTLSEDSCSPKRKCISLNGDSHDRFGVPLQVLSYSKMSKSERRDLELRLKRELEEVRIMQRRVASFSTSAVVLSPSSDIRSCSDGQKRPPLENIQRMPDHAPQGKKRPPQGRNGPRSKKMLPGHNDPPKQAVPMNISSPMLMKQCENLLNRLMGHQYGWVFNTPVDVVKLNIPDYFNVIKHPMDLGTIKCKLARGEYSSPLEFAADVRLTFSNAMTYNPPGNDVHLMAQTLSKHFEQRWKAIEKKIPANADAPVLPSRMEAPVQNGRATDPVPPAKKKKVAPVGHVGKVEPVKRVMSVDDKHKLSMELESLLGDLPESIIEFLKDNSSGAEQTTEDEIEIDIDALSDDVLFKLRKLLDDFVLEKKKHQTKAEPCEMELHNESGFSNSSIQPGKGNDAADEDVDIGGNDHPVSSFPPVEIEKDTANKNSRCSSPSSSSSDSGSSSSHWSLSQFNFLFIGLMLNIVLGIATALGYPQLYTIGHTDALVLHPSDSDSSSSSESEGQKALPRANKLQGTMNADPKLDRNRSEVFEDDGRDQSLNGLSQAEQNQQIKAPSVDEDGHKEGESAPSERQVSPDKLYRAALLRSRFADTILKAQEKTLDKMEKTVEINENCQFMEDLEMLTAAPPDNLSSFIDDASPHDSQNGGGLGSFRFRANSNPLEQLGLYMKDDGEDEEEVEAPQSAPDLAANDVEEGEID